MDDVPDYRASISSLTKLSPSVSFTPLKEYEYLVAVTDKYYICSTNNLGPNYRKIIEKSSNKLLAKHQIDFVVESSLLINQHTQLLFHSDYTLYMQDQVNINNSPQQLFKSNNGWLRNIVKTSDGSHSIVCNENEVIAVSYTHLTLPTKRIV